MIQNYHCHLEASYLCQWRWLDFLAVFIYWCRDHSQFTLLLLLNFKVLMVKSILAMLVLSSATRNEVTGISHSPQIANGAWRYWCCHCRWYHYHYWADGTHSQISADQSVTKQPQLRIFLVWEVVGVVRPAPTTSLSVSEDVIVNDEARNFCWLPRGGHSSVQLCPSRFRQFLLTNNGHAGSVIQRILSPVLTVLSRLAAFSWYFCWVAITE